MTFLEAIVVAGFGLQLTTFVGVAVWAVGKMRTSNAVLAEAIEGLRRTVARLENAVEKLDGELGAHGERIAKLEGRR